MSLAVTRDAAWHVRLVMSTIETSPAQVGPTYIPWDSATAPRWQERWWLLPVGAITGLALGAVARWWMRLITDDPEFTWAGTIFIVAAFTVCGLGHAIAWATRARSARRRWSTLARVVAAVLTLPLFAGAGALMLPTVAAGSLARWRRDWVWPVRALLALGAAIVPVLVVYDVLDHSVAAGRLLGLALMAATYWTVIASTRAITAPLDDAWRLPRMVRLALVIACALAVLLIAIAIAGV